MSFCSPAIFAATLLLTGATAWIAGSTLHLDLYMVRLSVLTGLYQH